MSWSIDPEGQIRISARATRDVEAGLREEGEITVVPQLAAPWTTEVKVELYQEKVEDQEVMARPQRRFSNPRGEKLFTLPLARSTI